MLFLDNETGSSTVEEYQSKKSNVLAFVSGAVNDTFTIQCKHPDSSEWIDVVELAPSDSGGWVEIGPVPNGIYRVVRDAQNDAVTLIVDF